MKYLKKFENTETFLDYGKYYWVVYSNDTIYITASLKKIEFPDDIISDTLFDIKNCYNNANILFFGYENRIGRGEMYDVQEYEEEFINKNYKFMGEIKLTEKEIEDIKINQNIKKFNI